MHMRDRSDDPRPTAANPDEEAQMPGNDSGSAPAANQDFRLRTSGLLSGADAGGPWSPSRYSLGGPQLQLEIVPELKESMLRQTLFRHDLLPLWNVIIEHGRPLLQLPFPEPKGLPRLTRQRVKIGDPQDHPKLIFEIPPLDDALIKGSKSLAQLASLLGLDTLSMRGSRLWIVYENDGSLPNAGSGSDQGPTAFFGLYLSFDRQRTGLTRLGWTVIDMRTPRPTLPPGQPADSSGRYETPPGPYSGISSIDFTVTALRTGTVKVDITGAAGVDSTRWGKFVQDVIHTKVSNSPLLPWSNNPEKLFAQAGVAALWTPNKVLQQGNVFGISYEGKIELGGNVTTGSHRTEATAEARYVIRTASVMTPLGDISAEYSPLGAFARGFLRYNDGRTEGFAGVEGGVNTKLMVNIGRLGIGLAGDITMSTDPALQTPNPAGWGPLLSPLTGAPAGHHGRGQVVLTWRF
jgi:hypothetical protein